MSTQYPISKYPASTSPTSTGIHGMASNILSATTVTLLLASCATTPPAAVTADDTAEVSPGLQSVAGASGPELRHRVETPETPSRQAQTWREQGVERLILVTFEARSHRGLRTPGSTTKGYGGRGRAYKTLPTSEKTSRDLAERYGLVPVDDWPIALLDVHCVVYSVPGTTPIDQVITRLARDARVQTVQPLQEFEVLGVSEGVARDGSDGDLDRGPDGAPDGLPHELPQNVPHRAPHAGSYDDPYLPHQTGLQRMRIEDAHAWATGAGVKVAVIDTGVDLAHPDLDLRIALARDCTAAPTERSRGHPAGTSIRRASLSRATRSTGCRDARAGDHGFSSDAHGTAVAGLIASTAGNGEGIVGVAPGVRLLAIKACWYPTDRPDASRAICDTFTLAKAIQLAADEGADILNLSLTGPPDPLVGQMLARVLERGTIVVGAVRSGNSSPTVLTSHPDILTVDTIPTPGSTSARKTATAEPAAHRAGTPSPTTTLFAPGDNVITTQPGGRYDFVTGSSFAAAHVTGLAALLLERDRLPATRVRDLLARTSHGPAGVHACDALARLLHQAPCPATPALADSASGAAAR